MGDTPAWQSVLGVLAKNRVAKLGRVKGLEPVGLVILRPENRL